jgi:hypothetical protein
LGIDNVIVQARVETRNPHHVNRSGLALVWENGASVFAGPELRKGQFRYELFGTTSRPSRRYGSEVNRANPGKMHQVNWVRIELHPEQIVFAGSSDGEGWQHDHAVPRPPELAGPPRAVRLGKNPDGHEDRHMPARTADYYDDLVVGSAAGR